MNTVSQKNAYPLPYIRSILNKLRGARYFSSIDLKQGYWQVSLAEDIKPIIAFIVPNQALFQFRVIPFGLHSACATFQKLLDAVLNLEMDSKAFGYLNDLIVLGKTRAV